jgi:predicted amidohydrolase
MANLAMDPIQAFGTVADQANAFVSRYPGTRIVIAPEYFLNKRIAGNANTPQTVSRSGKHSLYGDLKGISRRLGPTILIAGTIFYKKGLFNKVGLNVCPVLQNGQIIYKYYKAMDDGGLHINDPDATFETKATGPVFTADGIVFGIDVCGDVSDDAAFRRNWNMQFNSGAVQVHIVIADGAGVPLNRIQAGANGAVIYTDLAGGSSVRQSATGEWRAPTTGPNAGRLPFATRTPEIIGVEQATGATIKVFRLTI